MLLTEKHLHSGWLTLLHSVYRNVVFDSIRILFPKVSDFSFLYFGSLYPLRHVLFFFFFFFLIYWFERGRGREGREKERDIDLLSHWFMHSLGACCMCPDLGLAGQCPDQPSYPTGYRVLGQEASLCCPHLKNGSYTPLSWRQSMSIILIFIFIEDSSILPLVSYLSIYLYNWTRDFFSTSIYNLALLEFCCCWDCSNLAIGSASVGCSVPWLISIFVGLKKAPPPHTLPYFLVLWDTPDSFCVFFASVIDSDISPRNPVSFYWKCY